MYEYMCFLYVRAFLSYTHMLVWVNLCGYVRIYTYLFVSVCIPRFVYGVCVCGYDIMCQLKSLVYIGDVFSKIVVGEHMTEHICSCIWSMRLSYLGLLAGSHLVKVAP